MKKLLCGAALVAATVLSASQAQAAPVTFDSAGDSQVITFFLEDPDGTGNLSPLQATATLTVFAVDSDSLELWIKLENTTGGDYTKAGLASFGFGIDPNATSVSGSTTGGILWDTGADTDVFAGYSLDFIPSLKPQVEICSWAGNNCHGGGQGGLLAMGQTDYFKMLLNFAPGDGSYELSDFGVKFQTNAGSYEFFGFDTVRTTDNPGGPTGPTQSPEPALLSILGVGLAGAAYRLRRR